MDEPPATSHQPPATSHYTDHQSYKWSGRALQVGMYLSFGCMVAGLAWWLGVGAPGGEDSARRGLSFDRFFPELWSGNPLALLNLGVVLLLVTPAAALFALIITFAISRNWRFTLISLLVGAILAVSMAISLFGR